MDTTSFDEEIRPSYGYFKKQLPLRKLGAKMSIQVFIFYNLSRDKNTENPIVSTNTNEQTLFCDSEA